MFRRLHLMLTFATLCCLGSMSMSKEITDPEEAKTDPDFSIQGEYVAEFKRDGETHKMAAQVIARGKGRFELLGLKGGLPGDGWKRGDDSIRASGRLEDGAMEITIEDKPIVVKFADGKMTLSSPDDNEPKLELKRIERKSPTLCAKPPEGAVVIFDGKNLDMFEGADGHLTEDKLLLSGVTTKADFGSYKLHLEFRLSWMPEAGGQGRSNSGIYIDDCYECQVLDSFGLEGKNNESGGFYSIKEPDVNMCLPPLTWQTYDIDFRAAEFADGKKVKKARITIRHNGVVIHDDIEIPRGTPGRKGEGPGPRAIHIQGHGNKVMYRNIWLQKK